jgi:hypothetical protein
MTTDVADATSHEAASHFTSAGFCPAGFTAAQCAAWNEGQTSSIQAL